MSRSGKRMKAIREQLESGKAYAIDEALDILKGLEQTQIHRVR